MAFSFGHLWYVFGNTWRNIEVSKIMKYTGYNQDSIPKYSQGTRQLEWLNDTWYGRVVMKDNYYLSEQFSSSPTATLSTGFASEVTTVNYSYGGFEYGLRGRNRNIGAIVQNLSILLLLGNIQLADDVPINSTATVPHAWRKVPSWRPTFEGSGWNFPVHIHMSL